MGAERRRVQLTGRFTYIVSLPKRWAESVGLGRGDYVLLVPQPDMSLLVVPDRLATRGEAVEEIALPPTKDPEGCVRNVIAAYLAGYDVIRIGLPKYAGEAYVGVVKDAIRHKLVGVEVIDESADEMVVRCLVKYTDLPLRDAVDRVFMLIRSMCIDLDRAFGERDLHLLGQIHRRDDDVDRLHFLVLRQLRKAVRDRKALYELGLHAAHECLDYQRIAGCLERMADHISRAACAMKDVLGGVSGDVLLLLKEMCGCCLSVLDRLVRALHKLDVRVASEVFPDVRRASDVELEAIQALIRGPTATPMVILHARIALESLRRLCEYGADVAEVVIDLSTGREREGEGRHELRLQAT